MRFILLFILAVFAHAAPAQEAPMTGAEFRAFAEGHTLHFEDETGEHFGSEQYFEGGQTLWLPRGGQCERGVWTAESGRICFLYAVGIACWRVYRLGENDLAAISADDLEGEPTTRLRLTRRDRTPLICPDGPAV